MLLQCVNITRWSSILTDQNAPSWPDKVPLHAGSLVNVYITSIMHPRQAGSMPELNNQLQTDATPNRTSVKHYTYPMEFNLNIYTPAWF